MPVKKRKAIIDHAHVIPVIKQCRLVQVSRSSIYYQSVMISDEDHMLMRLINAIHLNPPFLGSRRIRDERINRGHQLNRKKVQRLMWKMGIMALYPSPGTSCPSKGLGPFDLFKEQNNERPNPVWATDITYLPTYRRAKADIEAYLSYYIGTPTSGLERMTPDEAYSTRSNCKKRHDERNSNPEDHT